MKYKEFPEEKYEVVLENKKLREEIFAVQSKQYNRLLEENSKMQEEINRLKDEKIKRLEFENQLLKTEFFGPNKHLLLEMKKKKEFNPLEIIKFVYISNIFKYYNDDGSYGVKDNMDDTEFCEIMKRIFPDATINILGDEMHVAVMKDENYLGNYIVELNKQVRVSDIDDWIEKKLNTFRIGVNYDFYHFEK